MAGDGAGFAFREGVGVDGKADRSRGVPSIKSRYFLTASNQVVQLCRAVKPRRCNIIWGLRCCRKRQDGWISDLEVSAKGTALAWRF